MLLYYSQVILPDFAQIWMGRARLGFSRFCCYSCYITLAADSYELIDIAPVTCVHSFMAYVSGRREGEGRGEGGKDLSIAGLCVYVLSYAKLSDTFLNFVSVVTNSYVCCIMTKTTFVEKVAASCLQSPTLCFLLKYTCFSRIYLTTFTCMNFDVCLTKTLIPRTSFQWNSLYSSSVFLLEMSNLSLLSHIMHGWTECLWSHAIKLIKSCELNLCIRFNIYTIYEEIHSIDVDKPYTIQTEKTTRNTSAMQSTTNDIYWQNDVRASH